ncbi:MAG: DUF885 domain-containing protein [Armatimonadota bacterium]|nr:DUF885 domain-containing protein [Armatimonadota bacterium]MDR7520575.1 DUF885 domain-containing protein [Armatimonadota bacterium]MDR7549718.1 DUF885 domain-containing protein [Armatimonadota bacterium]
MAAPVEFEQLAHGFLADYLEFYPTLGMSVGLHLYDGRAGDYSPQSIDAWLRTLDGWARRFAAMGPDHRTGQAALDAALIEQAIEHERFRWTVLRDHEWNPMGWSGLFDVTAYLKRTYAPLRERARAMTSHLEDIPRIVEEMRGHLRAPLALPVVETAQDVFEGYLAFYTTDLPRQLGDRFDPDLRRRLDGTVAAAADAVRRLCGFLDEARGRATQAVAIGEPVLLAMLRTGEMIEVPLDRLLALGEAELARLHEDVREAAAQVDPKATPREVMARLGREHPSEETLIPEARAMLEDLRRFLVEREIVTLPDVRPLVEETPPFARWAFAMMDTVGPFEEVATESYYYITPPEPDWPPERREEWLTKFDYATLKAVSIHEAYPGHFVHFMRVRHAPSMAAKILTAYSFVEGWAHYCEEMMLEAGVDAGVKFRLACLGEALVRLVRYLAAIHMHAGGMTVDQAATMFQEQAFMEPLPARKEAVRGTFDPGYLNYTMGKFMIRRLREDYRAARGSAFTLREFHDRLIGLGAPPLPLARRALLGRSDGPGL